MREARRLAHWALAVGALAALVLVVGGLLNRTGLTGLGGPLLLLGGAAFLAASPDPDAC